MTALCSKMRKFILKKLFLSLVVVFAVLIYIKSLSTVKGLHYNLYRLFNHNKSEDFPLRITTRHRNEEISTLESTTHEKIVVSFVVCDDRFSEALNVVKSVLIFTRIQVHFVIIADDVLRPKFNKTLTKWQGMMEDHFEFELHKIKFPEANEKDWLNLFSKCAAQRLFMPKLLPHIDALIYVDTDTLFLGPVEHLWQVFHHFNSSQITAMAVEDENPNISWYPRFAKHPFYGKYGLNSGVMLMNLTRMRNFGWVDYVTPIMLKYKIYIPWGDQDIINIILHYHVEAVLVLGCRYNYRTDQCVYGDACADATRRGVFVLHASRGAFHNHKQPAFQAIYRAINEYELSQRTPSSVLPRLKQYLAEVPPSNCGNLREAFLRVPTETLSRLPGTTAATSSLIT